MKINIAIADDHSVVINGLQQMLQASEHINIINVYDCGKSLLEGLKIQRPEVLLLDIRLPDYHGYELSSIISKTYPDVRILAMTAFNMIYYVRLMLQNGASGYLLKNTNESILLQAIETVHQGEQFIDPSLRQQLLQDLFKIKKRAFQKITLTIREKDVLHLIMQERTSQEIGDQLNLSLRTVEHYRTNLMQKLNVKNTVGLVKAVFEMNLLGE